jgi:hypothetical protein
MKILFLGSEADRPYLYNLKGIVSTYSLFKHTFIEEIVAQYSKSGITHIITTHEYLIPLLCNTSSDKDQILDNYAGSWITHSSGMEFLFVHPLQQLITVPYGKLLFNRYVSKFTSPKAWVTQDTFTYKVMETLADYESCLGDITSDTTLFVAVDIETRPDLSISSVSYTCFHKDFKTSSHVMPLPYGLSMDEYNIRYLYLRRFNNTPDSPKVLQNGKYDCLYFQRYNIPLAGYYFDTQLCHHAWYAELPKALDILATFYVRQTTFWKNEGDGDLYYYNALDTWHTAWVLAQWLAEAPEWAKNNYLLSFQTLAPNFLMESIGLAVNYDTFYKVKEIITQGAQPRILDC